MARMRHDRRKAALRLAAAIAVFPATATTATTATAATTSTVLVPTSISALLAVSHTASSSSSSSNAAPTVYNASAAGTAATGVASSYTYHGCFLEISGMNGTAAGTRSLQGTTTDEVLPGDMTVAKCLAFCGGGGSGSAYTYAGLEYARECWCGSELAALAAQEPEADCNLPCDGDNATLCGGNLRITLYVLSSAGATRPAVALAAVLVAIAAAL